LDSVVENFELIGREQIFEALNPHQKMRLHFLLLALRDAQAEHALIVAEQMEKFITADRQGSASELPSAGAVGSTNNAGRSDGPDTIKRVSSAKGVLSDKAFRSQFVSAISSGADNRQLAERFGLTLRQANGLRLGLARRKTSNRAGADPLKMTEVTEQQRAEFLRQREPSPSTIEDLVRFLRQRGDVIVRRGENFLLDSRHVLTAGQLLERANRKRRELGKSEFLALCANGSELPIVAEQAAAT